MDDTPIASPPDADTAPPSVTGRAGLMLRLAGLKASLRAALLAGGNTAEIREQIAEAEAEAVLAAARLAEREAQALEERLLAQDVVADGLMKTALARLAAEFMTDENIGESNVSQEVLDRHAPAIAAATGAVAAARAEVADARAALEAPNAARRAIAARIADLEAQRVALVSRRAAGRHEIDDAGQLLLIAADIEGLRGEHARATAELAPVEARYQAALTALSRADLALSAAERAARQDGLIDQLDRLDAAMRSALGQLHSLVPPGLRPAWGASVELRTTLRNLAVQRHEL